MHRHHYVIADSISSLNAQETLLFVVNSGRASKHYITALAAAARKLCLRHYVFDLAPFWKAQREGHGHAAAEHLLNEAQIAGVSRIIGYAHNPIAAGLTSDKTPVNVFAREGIACTLLWTDHPQWATGGDALLPDRSRVLGHRLHTHIVKSPLAAMEAQDILRWPNITSCMMAQSVPDFCSVRSVEFDAVMVVSDAAPVTAPSEQYLRLDDPDPTMIDAAHAPLALSSAVKALRNYEQGGHLNSYVQEWIEHKLSNPNSTWWQIVSKHKAAREILWHNPTLYYNVTAALTRLTSWRRNFWPAWLAKRVHLGVFGCDAACWGVSQSSEQRNWVHHDQLSEVYRFGACAININAGHDETGLTHKPFQIASASVPLVHHAVSGLEDAFRISDTRPEAFAFTRGPELLAAINACKTTIIGHQTARLGWERCVQSHDWKHRLSALCGQGAEYPLAA